MPSPSFSRTITKILEMRGRARSKAATSTEPLDNAAEFPSNDTIATDTIPRSRKNTKVPSTSAESITSPSQPKIPTIPLTDFTVASLLLGSRPLPVFSFDTPGGQFVLAHAAEVGVPPADFIEHMVAWAYRMRANMGEYTLEDLALFYKDNRPEWWVG